MSMMQQQQEMCPVHGLAFIWKPAGVSRTTGRPYNAFQCCPVQGCRARPGQPFAQPVPSGGFQGPPQQNQVIRTGRSDPRPTEDVAGKVRHGLVVAMIGAGWEWERIQSELPRYVGLVMHGAGQLPEPQDADVPF